MPSRPCASAAKSRGAGGFGVVVDGTVVLVVGVDGGGALVVGAGREVTRGVDDAVFKDDAVLVGGVILVAAEGFSCRGTASHPASTVAPTAPRKTRRLMG